MTNDIQLYQSILKSWEICSQKGLSKELGKPLIKLKADEIKKISGKKKDKIEKFSDFMYRHLDTLKNIKNAFCFLLFDEDGYLLSIKHRPGTVEKRYEYKDFFVPGVSFSEESIGTNSVSMAMLLKRSIHMQPEFHYCTGLKFWHEYCVPVSSTGSVNGYICVVSILQPISKALEGFSDLLAFNLCSEEHGTISAYTSGNMGLSPELTEKQNLVLRMLAQGFSDEHISQELKLSLATVKYHNQIIFKKLNAISRVDAVVKAIMLNKLSYYDLYSLHA